MLGGSGLFDEDVAKVEVFAGLDGEFPSKRPALPDRVVLDAVGCSWDQRGKLEPALSVRVSTSGVMDWVEGGRGALIGEELANFDVLGIAAWPGADDEREVDQ